eukprot:SAG31_NODE_16768_length_697_cov_0.892977_1_plen_165_part_10
MNRWNADSVRRAKPFRARRRCGMRAAAAVPRQTAPASPELAPPLQTVGRKRPRRHTGTRNQESTSKAPVMLEHGGRSCDKPTASPRPVPKRGRYMSLPERPPLADLQNAAVAAVERWPALTKRGTRCKLCLKLGKGVFCAQHQHQGCRVTATIRTKSVGCPDSEP